MEDKSKRIKIEVAVATIIIVVAIVSIVVFSVGNRKKENIVDNNVFVKNQITQENKTYEPVDSPIDENPSSTISTPKEEGKDKVSGSGATE